MHEGSRISPHILRGLQLKDLGRYADAEKAFKEALSQEPNDVFALHQLAVCQYHQRNRLTEALATIDSAIAIEPNLAEHRILRSFILSSLERAKEALEAARMAIGFDPHHSGAFTAAAQAHLHLENWKLAEESAREALALDADNPMAANQLAQALRLQNKREEIASHLAGMLARDPEDPYTHANAGWSALQRGDRRTAESHFREALRLHPGFESAREGLLASFRARSPVYRGYLHYCFAMQRLRTRSRWAVVLGIFCAVQLTAWIPDYVALPIIALYLLFILWVWMAKPIGNILLLTDSFARYALRGYEKVEALVVTVVVAMGMGTLIWGAVLESSFLANLGVASIVAGFPLSMTFSNGSKRGRRIFAAIAGFAILSVVLAIAAAFVSLKALEGMMVVVRIACIACVVSTWLGNLPSLRRPVELA